MSEERRIILNLLAEGKITADEAEQLLDALDETDLYDLGSFDEAGSGDSGDQCDEERLDDLSDLGERLGAQAEVMADDLSERLSKAVSEMAEAGQELPDRLGRMFGSMFGSFGWSPGYVGVRAERTFESEMPADCRISAIDLATRSGSIKLAGWDRPGYKVVARAKVRGADSQAEAERKLASSLRLLLDGGVMRVDCTDQAIRDSLSIEAYVPGASTYDIKVNTRNGSARVESLNSRSMEVRSSNGRVALEDTNAQNTIASARNGSLSARGDLGDAGLDTANGSISVTLSYESAGKIRVNTANGSVRLYVPREARVAYEIDAQTVNGSVKNSLDGAHRITRETGARRGGHRGLSVITCPDNAASSPPVVAVDARALNGSVSVQSV